MIKKFTKAAFVAGTCGLLTACVSTKTADQIIEQYSQDLAPVVQIEEEHIPTPIEIYSEKISGLSLSVVSTSGEVINGKEFKKPYVAKVVDSENKPVPNIGVVVSIPKDRRNDDILYDVSRIKTNDEGTISFTPPVPQKSFDSKIKLSFDGDFSDAEVKAKAEEIAVYAPYKVQTNLKNAGGVIAIVDFNQNSKPITSNPVSSSNFLMSLMQLGFTRIGNIDLTNQVLNGDPDQLQKSAKAMVGNTSYFLVYGTVKYDSVEKTDEGSTVTLVGEIKCLSLKDGSMLYSATKKVSETNKNEWNALAAARKTLSEQFAQDLKYGI
ncbi:MAG: hypothetical protein KBT11_02170 [Treponema sp.]|nr:hypothetical protein [Candidatus Treponema equifaecale]